MAEMFARFLLLVPLIVWVSGCATTGQGTLPEWVLNPPGDTADTIYGVGEGEALRTARDDALAVIAGKLETRVVSDVETSTTLKNGREESFVSNRVRTTTEALKFSDYQTENNAQVGNRLFVMLSVDRNTLTKSILNDLKRLDSEIVARTSGIENASKLKVLYRLTLAKNLISEAVDKILLVQSVGQNPSLKQERLDFYRMLLEERQKMQQNLVLGVAWDRFSTGVGERVLNMLLSLGLHAEIATSGGNYDGSIVVSGTVLEQEMFDEYHAQLKAVVALKDSRGSEISSARYEAAASSLANHDAAIKSANRQIANEVEQQGIWRALNMHKGS